MKEKKKVSVSGKKERLEGDFMKEGCRGVRNFPQFRTFVLMYRRMALSLAGLIRNPLSCVC